MVLKLLKKNTTPVKKIWDYKNMKIRKRFVKFTK